LQNDINGFRIPLKLLSAHFSNLLPIGFLPLTLLQTSVDIRIHESVDDLDIWKLVWNLPLVFVVFVLHFKVVFLSGNLLVMIRYVLQNQVRMGCPLLKTDQGLVVLESFKDFHSVYDSYSFDAHTVITAQKQSKIYHFFPIQPNFVLKY
jgi:hypothetical protein